MNTLIKWPGGKKNEIKYIKNLIPQFDNYVEPFFGGGALFFELEPKNAYINDYSTDLIQFYQILSEKKSRKILKKRLMEYNKYWDSFTVIMEQTSNELLQIYYNFKNNKIESDELKNQIITFVTLNNNLFWSNYPEDKVFFKEVFEKELIKNLFSKIKRTKKIDLKNNFSKNEVLKNIETALRSAFYMHERHIMNQIALKKMEVSKEENTANYYFVREYCYGSMFRYNKKGEFNIPYGGISYNTKNFKNKIDLLFSEDTKHILKDTIIENLDFEQFLNKYEFTEKDFIFFDPPYDTDFSSYAKNNFTLEDQKRLAECIINLKAKFILIIKNTNFIYDLYKNKEGIYIETFEKKYSYNVKGRNERKVEHLIIHNIKRKENNIKKDKQSKFDNLF
jgi:DNA adenine methylase